MYEDAKIERHLSMPAPWFSVSDRLRMALTWTGKTDACIAEMSGISKATISRYVAGETDPCIEDLCAVANALGVNFAWIVGFDK